MYCGRRNCKLSLFTMTLDRITFDPAVLNGKACIRDMRMSAASFAIRWQEA